MEQDTIKPLIVHDASLKAGATVSLSDAFITSIVTAAGAGELLIHDARDLVVSIDGVVQDPSQDAEVSLSQLGHVTVTAPSSADAGLLTLELFDASGTQIVGIGQLWWVTSPNGDAPITTDFNGIDYRAGGHVNQTFVSQGGGLDDIIMPDAFASYIIHGSADSVVLTDQHGVTFTTQGIQQFNFHDTTKFIESADNANVARLYSAAFDRAPDLEGLVFWENVYANSISASAKAAGYYVALSQTDDGAGTSIAGSFMQSSEFINKYGSLTDFNFVDAMYHNVLGRGADGAGASFWLDQLSHGTTREMVLVGFAESPENVAKTGGDSGWLLQV